MTGMSAWAGLNLVGVRSFDTIFISGAAGAVGNVARQLARTRGCRVIGSTGSADKVNDPSLNGIEADKLYELLERDVIPEFYIRNADGIPTAWVSRMRESMARLTPRFSANRTVREYTEEFYLPAADGYRLRVADGGAIGRQIVDWQHSLERRWDSLHFCELKVETLGEQHLFEIQLNLNGLDSAAFRVDLYVDGANGSAAVRQEMQRVDQGAAGADCHVYRTAVPASRPAADYTARAIPRFPGVAVPLESSRILWQR
jgi:glycogen phosphorylase